MAIITNEMIIRSAILSYLILFFINKISELVKLMKLRAKVEEEMVNVKASDNVIKQCCKLSMKDVEKNFPAERREEIYIEDFGESCSIKFNPCPVYIVEHNQKCNACMILCGGLIVLNIENVERKEIKAALLETFNSLVKKLKTDKHFRRMSERFGLCEWLTDNFNIQIGEY